MKILEGVELDPKEFRDRAGISPRMPSLQEETSDYMSQLADIILKRLGPNWYRSNRPDPTFHHNEYYFVVKETGDDVFLITQVGNHKLFPKEAVKRTAAAILQKVNSDIPLRDEAGEEA